MDVSARIVTLELAETFVISRSARDSEDVVVVELRHSGVSGFGEAQPDRPLRRVGRIALGRTSRSTRSCSATTRSRSRSVMERLPAREFAARAALDAALHDLQGKLLGQPVWRLLGLRRSGPPTSWTVWLGDPDDMARRAEKALDRFRRLKLKLGGRDGLDVDRVRAVRGVAGDLPLQVDVNEAWSLDEALDCAAVARRARCRVLRAAAARRAIRAAPELKERSPLPIYVDEDCHTLADVAACAERAHGINVKLAKSGGIREAVRMVHAARALGLGCMLGCMVESGLGISAGAQVASLFDHVDLDGNLLLAHDPWPGVPFVDGVQLPPDEPGLGVHCGICCSLRASRATRTTGRRCAACCATAARTSSRSSTRRAPGRRRTACPIVGDVEEALAARADDRARRRRDAGRLLPARLDRELLRACVEHGLDVENGLHVFLGDDPELGALAAERGVELRDLRRPPADLSTATGENLAVDATIVLTVGSDCAIGKMTVSLRARPRGAAARSAVGVRPDRPDGHGDRRLGDRRRRRRGRLHRRRGRTARRRGTRAAAASCSGSRARARCSIRSTPASTLGLYHGSAPHLLVLCHEAGRTEIEGAGGGPHPIPPLARARRAARAARPAGAAGARRGGRAQHARCSARTRRGAAIAAAEEETGLPADDPVRFGAGEARRRRACRSPPSGYSWNGA